MKVFPINGVSLSGKDTFCNFVVDAYCACAAPTFNRSEIEGRVRVLSTIDPVKEIYRKFFGWNGEKTPEHRKNLNMLKHIWIKTSNGPHVWLQNMLEKIQMEQECDIVFIMVREFEEMLDAVSIGIEVCGHAETIQLIRDGIPIPPIEQEFLNSHPNDYVYDWTIVNPTITTYPNVPKLAKAAELFVDRCLLKYAPQTSNLVWNPVDEKFVGWIYKQDN